MAKITMVEEKSSPAMPSLSRNSESRTLLAVAAASPRTISTLGTYKRAKGAGRAFKKYKRAAILDCFLIDLMFPPFSKSGFMLRNGYYDFSSRVAFFEIPHRLRG